MAMELNDGGMVECDGKAWIGAGRNETVLRERDETALIRV